MNPGRQMMTSYFVRLADGQVVFYPQYQYLKTLPEGSTRAGYYLNNPEDQTQLQTLIDRHQWQIQFLWIAFCFIPLAITSIPEPLAGGYGRLYAKLVMTLLAMLSIAKFETNWQKKLTQITSLLKPYEPPRPEKGTAAEIAEKLLLNRKAMRRNFFLFTLLAGLAWVQLVWLPSEKLRPSDIEILIYTTLFTILVLWASIPAAISLIIGNERFDRWQDRHNKARLHGTQLINSWVTQAATNYSGTIAVTAGTWVPIYIEHHQGGGGEQLTLYWSSSHQSSQVIPAANLGYAPGPLGR